MKFAELGLSPNLLAGISALGFESPTAVQAKVIPFLLESKKDIVALAQTGTGKTAAFSLPILELLNADKAVPQALILCPTRELCMQIARDMDSFSAQMRNVRVLAVYGGTDIQRQLTALNRGVHIIVATPGRMLDILKRKKADFSHISHMVLDEADEMLDMGFQEDLEAILSRVPEEAQTLLFSATMPAQVAKIARQYMSKPEEITVGTRNAGAENVSHEVMVVHAKDRYRALRRIVDFYPHMYGLVFCRTRQETQQIADHLGRDGYVADALHGDLSQQQRDRVMKKFRDRNVQVLVATDVAARGLDVNDLTHVINYNLPDDLNAYTHRSGRTGRAGKEGTSIAIVHMREHFKVNRIEKALGKKFKRRPVPTGEEISRARLVYLAERVRDCETKSALLDHQLDELCTLLEDLDKREVIKRFAALELERLLLYYRDAPDLKEDHATKRGEARERSRDTGGDMVELVMNVGKINGLTPKKLINLINTADRESSIAVGRINIVKMQAYFGVPEADAQGLIESFASSHLDLSGRLVSVARAGRKPPQGRGKSYGGKRKGPPKFRKRRN